MLVSCCLQERRVSLLHSISFTNIEFLTFRSNHDCALIYFTSNMYSHSIGSTYTMSFCRIVFVILHHGVWNKHGTWLLSPHLVVSCFASHYMATLQIGAVGEVADLARPCVDCGLITSNYCETVRQIGHAHWQGGICLAAIHVPAERWVLGQRTPLCTFCEKRFGACRFCRGVKGCTPEARANKITWWDQVQRGKQVLLQKHQIHWGLRVSMVEIVLSTHSRTARRPR